MSEKKQRPFRSFKATEYRPLPDIDPEPPPPLGGVVLHAANPRVVMVRQPSGLLKPVRMNRANRRRLRKEQT